MVEAAAVAEGVVVFRVAGVAFREVAAAAVFRERETTIVPLAEAEENGHAVSSVRAEVIRAAVVVEDLFVEISKAEVFLATDSPEEVLR